MSSAARCDVMSLVDVTSLCLVCTKPCRENQTDVPRDTKPCREDQTELPPSSSEAPQVTPASQLENELKTVLHIELKNDGPTLVCASCVHFIQTWQSMCETARTSRAFFERQTALRNVQPAAAACEMSHTEAGQGDRDRSASKRPVEPTSEPETKRAHLETQDSTTRPPVKLNDYCLASVLGYTDTRTRIIVQRVDQQWLRVGRQFRHLDAAAFMISSTSVLAGLEVPLYEDEEQWKHDLEKAGPTFHWAAFLRTLVRTEGSLQSIDLSGLSIRECRFIAPYINKAQFRGLVHITLSAARQCADCDRRTGVEEEHMDYGSHMQKKVQDPHCVVRICSLARLRYLKLKNSQNLDQASLRGIATRCLANLCSVTLASKESFGGELGYEEWRPFYEHLPDSLQHFSLEEPNHGWHLELLLDRLRVGLPCLTSFRLKLRSLWCFSKAQDVDLEEDGDMGVAYRLMDAICRILAPQLTQLEFELISHSLIDLLPPVGLLGELRRLRFVINVSDYRILDDVGHVLLGTPRLRELHLSEPTWDYLMRAELDVEQFISAVCGLVELRELSVPAVSVQNHLARLGESLPCLRSLALIHIPGEHPLNPLAKGHFGTRQLGGLISLVGRCTLLEQLDLTGLFAVHEFSNFTGLLRGMESRLYLTRRAPPCPHLAPKGVSSPLLPRGCDLCPAPTPLCVKLPGRTASLRARLRAEFSTSPYIRLGFLCTN